MKYLEEVSFSDPSLGELYDELPLWSAPFGLLMLDRVPMKRGLTVLDIGAGTGFLTVELAQRCGRDSKIIAVDPWGAALERLRRKIAHLGLTNVVLREQDAASLDLPDLSVDVIASNLGLNNFTNAAAVLAVCHRVARPDASLLVTTNLTGHMEELYGVYRRTLIDLGQENRLPALEAHVAHRGTVESVSELLGAAGFRTVNTVTQSFRMRFADGSSLLRHYFIRLGFVPAWKTIPAPAALHATFEALERNLNALAAERGELALTIPMALVEAVPAAPLS